MSEILIIFIEFLIIIILCLIIRGYVKERRMERDEIGKQFADAAYKRAEHTDLILKFASAIVIKLSQEMYRNMFKKNKIVKETCSKFYEELRGRLK
jgi:hypothetical protein